MSGEKREDQACTSVNEVEPTENVEVQIPCEAPKKASVERPRMYSQLPTGEADLPSESKTSSTIVKVALLEENVSTAESRVQDPVRRRTFSAESFVNVVGQATLYESVLKLPLASRTTLPERFDQLSLKESSLEESGDHNLLKGQIPHAESGVQVQTEGQTSRPESLVEFQLEGGFPLEASNFQVPLARRDFPRFPVENLPEINVENILRGTRGVRNQKLFPRRKTHPPYISLRQKMYLDDRKEIVDITKELKKKKHRFRVKFDDDTEESSSSSSEESHPPKSAPSSPELQFEVDL